MRDRLRFVEANLTFERQSGLVGAVGRRIREFAPDLEEHWLERYGTVALTGQSMRVEGEVAPLGRWFDINAFRVGSPAQRRVGVLFSDISSRRSTEATLRDSEERLRAIVETATDYAILTTDPEGQIETWSKGAEVVLGWSSDEIVGRSMDVIFTPEGRAAGRPEWERRTAREKGQAPDVRWHQRRDGSRVFIDGVVRPLAGSNGSPRGFVKIGQDITEQRAIQEQLRASEALFRQFSDASSDVLWIRDAGTMRFDYVSPAFEAIYGDAFGRVVAENDLRHWARLIVP